MPKVIHSWNIILTMAIYSGTIISVYCIWLRLYLIYINWRERLTGWVATSVMLAVDVNVNDYADIA